MTNPAFSFAKLRLNPITLEVRDAHACAFTYCVNKYSASTVNGVLQVNITSTVYGELGSENNILFGNLTISSGIPEAEVSSTNFTMDGETMLLLGATLGKYFIGNITETKLLEETPVTQYTTDVVDTFNQTEDFPGLIQNVAVSMTKHLLSASDLFVPGQVFVSEIYIVVRWLWIILPGIIVGLDVLFLVLAIFESRKYQTQLWTGSILPLMFHG